MKCPNCNGELSTSGGHGEWCPNVLCKYGWETELDGSPLKPVPVKDWTESEKLQDELEPIIFPETSPRHPKDCICHDCSYNHPGEGVPRYTSIVVG